MVKPFINLTHHFLLPHTMPDERFTQSLVYLCRHTQKGAWGFVINQPLSVVSVGGLLHEMDLPASQLAMNTPAMCGGVLRPEAGFVLHTGLPEYLSSFAISDNVCLTTSKDVLMRISTDSLTHFLLCMGFCSWGEGQLEQELEAGDWLVCPADLHILFAAKHADKLDLAYQKLGINKDKFTTMAGFA